MTNKDIARTFNDLARLMELHGENPYKIRSYANAYLTLRKLPDPLTELSDAEIGKLKGVGNAISSKIRELIDTGKLATLEKYRDMTPQGVQEMLQIKGFGPKKVKVVWKDLGAESIGELLYACNENRLIELNGFGQKTQEDLRKKLTYFLQSKDKFHYASLEPTALALIETLQQKLPDAKVALTGAMRRRCPIVERIDILVGHDGPIEVTVAELMTVEQQTTQKWSGRTEDNIPVMIHHCAPGQWGSKLFRFTGGDGFIDHFLQAATGDDFRDLAEEEAVFAQADLPFIAPELRDWEDAIDYARSGQLPELVEEKDIIGVLHTHTTYSDGLHSLREMAEYARDQGYGYIGITDHSQAAFYANGLKADRVLQQFAEIDQLNAKLAPFRIFKGIESDILNDGSLDYPDELLAQFDFIIASVHTNLKMDETKATQRLLKAIENPFTRILGHPTGRLLLSREGYPLDHRAIIDACATHNVVIELNANPYRLDLDWEWIPYALEKGVKIAINPDAHSTGGIHDIHFGVLAARKGGLDRANCLNSLDAEAFATFCKAKGH